MPPGGGIPKGVPPHPLALEVQEGRWRLLSTTTLISMVGICSFITAITGEKTLPVLNAAHIKPYAEEGPHEVRNGLLLREDLHTLGNNI